MMITHESRIIPLEVVPEKNSILPYLNPNRPLEVDIGAGKGRFIIARAAAHPETEFLGIERQLGRIHKMAKKASRQALDNVHVIQLEALYAINYLLPDESVSCFYFFFPDPWPKRRHHRRRLFSPEFLTILNRKLVPGGFIHVATDHLDYFAEIEKTLSADNRFGEIPAFVRIPEQQTDFEIIFRGKGLPIGECSFKKVSKPSNDTPSKKE